MLGFFQVIYASAGSLEFNNVILKVCIIENIAPASNRFPTPAPNTTIVKLGLGIASEHQQTQGIKRWSFLTRC